MPAQIRPAGAHSVSLPARAAATAEIDHFHPQAHGGADDLDNLVYACPACNRFKSDYWPAEDAPEHLRLLHPDQDDLALHVAETVSGRAVGLTPRGWFHIRWLHLNRPLLVTFRQLRQRFGLLVPSRCSGRSTISI